jgi:hypothetical protein
MRARRAEDAAVTAFFVAGLRAEDGTEEEAYAAIRAGAQAFTGVRPRERRIDKLMCRRGGLDCEAQVGRLDPIEGAIVTAILDLGTQRPFLIYCRSPESGGPDTQILVRSVYSVTEFTT